MTDYLAHQSMAMSKLPGLLAVIFSIGLIVAGIGGCTSSPPSTGQAPTTTPVALEEPRRCPTPLYPSQARPPTIPTYPNAQQVQVQTFGKTEMSGADQFHSPAYISRQTTFTTGDSAQAVRAFYQDLLDRSGWRLDDQTPTSDELYYFWGVDTKPWEDPPCNATPETGLPVFLLKLVIKEGGAGATQVEVLEGALLGF